MNHMNNTSLNSSNNLNQCPNEDFITKVKAKLRFSKRNKDIRFEISNSVNSSEIEKKEVNIQNTSPLKERVNSEVLSCFKLFILRSKRIRDLFPDIESLKHSKYCNQIISQISKCPEAHFGLAMIQAYEGDLDTALEHVKVALSEMKCAEYSIWFAVLTLFKVNSRKKAFQAMKIFRELIKEGQHLIDIYWALMHLALRDLLKCGDEIQVPEHFAAKIQSINIYFGALAWSEIFLRRSSTQSKGEILLKEMISSFSYHPEMYLKLWNYYYHTTQNFEAALQIIEKGYLEETTKQSEYTVVISLNYARTLFKNKKIHSCLELLQLEYTKHSVFTVILYHYGRLCVKSNESPFLGSAIGALEEALQTCSESRHGQIYYWLTLAYMKADEKIEAYNSACKGIILLESKLQDKHCFSSEHDRRNLKKIKEMQGFIDDMVSNVMRIEDFEKELENSPVNIEQCKSLKDQILEFDQVEGSICEANMWSKPGRNCRLSRAENILKLHLNSTRAKMKVYFRLIELYEQLDDLQSMLYISKEMVKRCRSPTVPVQVWVQANLLYGKYLERSSRVSEALLIYKSLAQVQPIPFIPGLDYTRELQRSYTKEDMENVVHRVNSKEKRYSYLCSSIQDFKLQRSKLVCSRQYISLAFLDDDEDSESNHVLTRATSIERSESELVGSRAPEPLPKSRISSIPCGDSANIGFSVTTSYFFLYKIGKTCVKHEFRLPEGVLALQDFLNTHHYWSKEGIEKDEDAKVKAKYWLGVCYFKLKDYTQSIEIFKDISHMLFQLGRTKMNADVQRYLKQLDSSYL